jgi:hypothetical protein
MLEQGLSCINRAVIPWIPTLNEEFANIPEHDATGVDRLFAPFEATDSASQCDHTGETLAGALFRFMMLDEHVLCHSLARACYSKGGGGP